MVSEEVCVGSMCFRLRMEIVGGIRGVSVLIVFCVDREIGNKVP